MLKPGQTRKKYSRARGSQSWPEGTGQEKVAGGMVSRRKQFSPEPVKQALLKPGEDTGVFSCSWLGSLGQCVYFPSPSDCKSK